MMPYTQEQIHGAMGIYELKREIPEKDRSLAEQCGVILLAALEAAEKENARLRDENVQDFRMDELDAVMYSVDKWLEGEQLKNNPATRAADAREIALKALDSLTAYAAKLEKAGDGMRGANNWWIYQDALPAWDAARKEKP